MSKIAFVFPGQGAQHAGMGKEFYERSEKAREIFDLASKATGLDIPALCFEENEKLNETQYTQIAGSRACCGCQCGAQRRRIWCTDHERCAGYGNSISRGASERHFYAGSSSDRRSDGGCDRYGWRTDPENLSGNRRQSFGGEL